MSLTINGAQRHTEQTQTTNAANARTAPKQSGTKGDTVFAGNVGKNLGQKGIIEQKREKAQNQAMRLIRNAWGRDQKAAEAIDDMRVEKEERLAKVNELRSLISDIEAEKSALQKEYEIDSDSQEHKDLELLEKYQNATSNLGTTKYEFTQEEIDRLKELQNMPRTEYQKKALKLNGQVNDMKKIADREEQTAFHLTKSITNAKIEQLKSQDMQKAGEAAEEIHQAVNEEIVDLLLKAGKDSVDEKMEEEQEEAEKVQEKQEEQEERIEAAKETREEQKEIIQGAAKAEQLSQAVTLEVQNTSNAEATQKQIQKLIEENNLVNEDLKGIKIDLNF